MTKQFYFISLLTVYIVFQANTCRKDDYCNDYTHKTILVKNNYSKRINYAFYWNYPDTTINHAFSPIHYNYKPIEIGDSTIRGIGMCGCWESIFENKSKEWIYFFDQDALDSIPWDTIKLTGRGILERRLITIEYLDNKDFKIIYP